MVTLDMIQDLVYGFDKNAKVITVFDYDAKNYLIEISEEPSNPEASVFLLVSKKKGALKKYTPLDDKNYERNLLGKKPLYSLR